VVGGQHGTHHATIRAALAETLANVELPEMYGGISRVKVFRAFHFPADKEEQQKALRALKFDEAICLQLALSERRKRRESVCGEVIWICTQDKIKSYFPYQFTTGQRQAVDDIRGDLASGTVMQRLLHADVGAGKSAVAFYCAMGLALRGKRTLILAPTTLLSQQHLDTLKGMGWKDVGLFDGPHTWSTRIIIGTHAILHDEELIRTASLIIIDEFSKFGVLQRQQITKHNPHLLLMSATPLPRSLAMTVFGDLDVSIIRELPIKRGTVITKWVLPEKRETMYEIIEKELAKGHQAYFVYPRISGDEDVVSAYAGLEKLIGRFGGSYTVDLLTGRYKAEDKVRVLQEFRSGKTDILVSTIIAEVGLDNPNATVMVIEGADRFGLSQLHQLRGRVCRSTNTAFCFLVSETSNPTSIARLDVVEKCNDGFLIAEHDLRLRGAGEVFSTHQSGLPDLKFVSLVDDHDLMIEAKETVQARSVGSGVREMMEMKYSLELGDTV